MKRVAGLGLVIITGFLFAAGCGGGSGSSSSTAQLRMVNAVYNGAGGGFDVLVASNSFTTGLTFGNATAFAGVASGSDLVEFRNTGTTTDIISQTVSLTGGTSYSFVAMGDTNALTGQVSGALFTDTTTAASSGNFQLRFINADTQLNALDIYVVPSTGNCGSYLYGVSADVSGLGFGSGSGYKTYSAGSFSLCFTQHGTKTANYYGGVTSYASGAVETIIIEDTSGGTLPLQIQTLTDATS